MPAPPTTVGEARLALVLFSGEADMKWLRILKPGFRHCFTAIESGPRWIIYNPLSHQTEIIVIEPDDFFRLVDGYKKQGLRMVSWVTKSAPLNPAPWAPYTCVEAIKRVLGIHAYRVATPWNLYNFLKKYND
ncbi:MAG: hypothetical protein HQ494_06450 [Rhodospirillales bacterium]|nr:hypothetical protein [Rhodospirillales bacterium]